MSLISTALPSGTPHGILIPSIGWTAMHSDLGKLSRTSVYFKSSPYGSYSHSHADQNSFVINSGGQRLAIDSGYYDSWTSPHRNGWYTNTKAHNAITYDGGVGQTISSLDSEGKITQFEHTPGYDLVTGDASLAYGGGLTKAVRSMVYLRPNTLVIFDSLESKTPRTWEWNIHALSKMGTLAGSVRHFLIDQAGVKLCVRMFVAPDGNVALSQTDQFTEAPQGTYPNQWHGRFSSLVKSTTARFVTVLEVGCSWTPVQVEHAGDSHYVTVLGNTLSFDGNTVTVR
ncbi:MAG: heparinase II/III family protein, partial [Candidatus Nitrotoga sp.]|nr:heparinase II/III family protein [Candidatus Nitrotoga sp.]